MKNKRLIRNLSIVPILLLIPLIAMQFSGEVNWTGMDFLIMGVLLIAVVLVTELGLRRYKKDGNRIAMIAVVICVFLLVWAEPGVGIFGTPFAGS